MLDALHASGRSQRLFVLSSLLLVLLTCGLESFYLWRLRNVAIENHLGVAAQAASAYEEHLTQTLSVVDFTLVNLVEKDADDQDLVELLRNARYVRSFSLIDAGGRVVRSSDARNLGAAFDAGNFLPETAGTAPVLRVGPLTQGRDLREGKPISDGASAPDQFHVAVQRDLVQSHGAAVKAVAVINPDYFLNFYTRNLIAEGATVELRRTNGGLLVSTSEQFVPGSQIKPAIQKMWDTKEADRLRDVAPDGADVLTAYRASRFFPLVVQVHFDQAQVLGGWRNEAITTVGVTALLLAFMLGTSWVYYLRTLRLSRERETWIRALNDQKYALDQHAIVSVTNVTGHITYANERFCSISGYTQHELLGQNHRLVNSGEHPPEFFRDMWKTISKGRVWHGEVCNRKKSGDVYWVSATIVPLFGEDGKIEQYVGIRTDITDRKLVEQSLQEARSIAEEASLAKSQFLANMSHEIRTPMNAVLGLLQLLRKTELNDRQRDYAVKSEDAAKSLLALLNDILDFSKVEAGKLTLESEPFRLDQLLRNLAVVLSANAESKDIEVLYEVDSALPEVVRGDVLRLQQVLVNLGGNAVKFTAHGQVVIALQKMVETEHALRLRVSVKDSGIGIAPEHLEHIFSGFSQAEASTTRRFGGTGLGLAISKRFVELMGGDLTVESRVGEGSTFAFEITLPVVREIPPELQVLDREPLLPRRVLVVDDNPVAAELMVAMMQSWKWDVHVAHSGAEALALIEQQLQPQAEGPAAQFPFSAVVIDWQMPGMDGWETTQKLRAMAQAAGLPQPLVVMVTAHGREMLSHRSEREQDMLNGFLVKPITASMLHDVFVDASHGTHRIRRNERRSSQRRLAGMRILVVEDNLINQQVADELLSAEGALVSLAANGLQGVEAVRLSAPPFDVVLMDIQMPVMDGYTATHMIRNELAMKQLPIVAMTANAMESDRKACLDAGMNEHVGKPFDMTRLANLLLQVTGLQPDTTPMDGATSSTAPSGPSLRIEGLDLDAALARMGGMQSLYLRTAKELQKSLPQMMGELRINLQAQDTHNAAMRLHTLKGNAGTLGLTQLASTAARFETQCKQPGGMAACLEQWDALFAATQAADSLLSMAMGSIAAHEATTRQPVAAPRDPKGLRDDAAARGVLQRLRALLAVSDMDALQQFAENRGTLQTLPEADLQRLENALQGLDFQEAMQCCDVLLNTTA